MDQRFKCKNKTIKENHKKAFIMSQWETLKNNFKKSSNHKR